MLLRIYELHDDRTYFNIYTNLLLILLCFLKGPMLKYLNQRALRSIHCCIASTNAMYRKHDG